MKPLLVLARITFVGCLWSIIFIEGIRVIMLENWHFDIFWPPHWAHAWNLWLSGWVIDTPKEWAFVLIILAFVPLWLTGWIALSLVPWEMLLCKLIMLPVKLFKHFTNPMTISKTPPVVLKKKSYKEVRPTGRRMPIYDYNNEKNSDKQAAAAPIKPVTVPNPVKEKAVASREMLNHAIFNMDDEDEDFDLDIDSYDKSDIFSIDTQKKQKTETLAPKKDKRERFSFDEEDEDFEIDEDDRSFENKRKKEPQDRNLRKDRFQNQKEAKNTKNEERSPKFDKNNRPRTENVSKPHSSPVVDVLAQRGFEVIENVPVKNTNIDAVAVSADKIYVCLVDKETGDWLADEEQFNGEDPLWFSENSHRISPVRKVHTATQKIKSALEDAGIVTDVCPYVIVQAGNIINAEDMFDVWEDMGVEVTRINRGAPQEIKTFSKCVDNVEEKISKEDLSAIKKALKEAA